MPKKQRRTPRASFFDSQAGGRIQLARVARREKSGTLYKGVRADDYPTLARRERARRKQRQADFSIGGRFFS